MSYQNCDCDYDCDGDYDYDSDCHCSAVNLVASCDRRSARMVSMFLDPAMAIARAKDVAGAGGFNETDF